MLELRNVVFDVPVSEGAKETKRIIDNLSLTIPDDSFTVILDGFLVSDNVTAVSVRNVQTGFVYSDHNPAVLRFILQ